MNIRFAEDGRQRVLEQAAALAGLEELPQEAEALLEAVACGAAAICNRRDLPREMEWPLAVLLSRALRDGAERPVTAVKRGDTQITYGPEDLSAKVLLGPFIRLGTPKGGCRCE
ncbi:MAG: hypothetical protein IK141_06705 [Clostridia bacterium]|nr:hypothetical protein [Clostridia bacterium]